MNPVAELDSSGNVITRYVYGTKSNIPNYIVKGDTTFAVITDHLGSVRMIVNSLTGEIIQRTNYDEFGNISTMTSVMYIPFTYAGGLTISHTGLIRPVRRSPAIAGRRRIWCQRL